MTDGFDHNAPQQGKHLVELDALTMRATRSASVHTIAPVGELDLATANRVEAELKRVEATDARAIVLDLAGLTFLSSSGIHLLLRAEARSRADSNRLTLLRGSPAVQRVLEICGVQDALPFTD